MKQPKFQMGQIVATPGALRALEERGASGSPMSTMWNQPEVDVLKAWTPRSTSLVETTPISRLPRIAGAAGSVKSMTTRRVPSLNTPLSPSTATAPKFSPWCPTSSRVSPDAILKSILP